jgi:hypothetical protein
LCKKGYISEHGWADGDGGSCEKKVAVRDPEEWTSEKANHGKPLLQDDKIQVLWEPKSGGEYVTLYNYSVKNGYPCA